MLPFQVEDSRVILSGARLGLVHETLALQAIRSHKPSPIAHQFGDNARNEANAMRFFPEVDVSDPASLAIANLSAFLYWDALWNGSRTRATVEQFAHATGCRSFLQDSLLKFLNGVSDSRKPCCDVWRWTPELEEQHAKFCETHSINPTSVRSIAEVIDSTWTAFYLSKFEPEWLRCSHPSPVWRCYERWINKGGNNATEMVHNVYGPDKRHHLVQALLSLSKNEMDAASQYAINFIGNVERGPLVSKQSKKPLACVHFLLGDCVYGNRCRHSHSPFATPPPCRFFQSGRCSKGRSCVYAHENDSSPNTAVSGIDNDFLATVIPVLPNLAFEGGSLQWFADRRSKLLLLGEGNFEFTRSLAKLRLSPAFASSLDDDVNGLYEIGSTDILSVDACRVHQNEEVRVLVASGLIENFSWNFPFTGIEENIDVHESLILGTFQSLHLLFAENSGGVAKFRLSFTFQGDQFSRWMVMRSAIRTGWHLERWGPFQSSDYPGYQPRRANGDTFPEASSRFYVFIRDLEDSDLPSGGVAGNGWSRY